MSSQDKNLFSQIKALEAQIAGLREQANKNNKVLTALLNNTAFKFVYQQLKGDEEMTQEDKMEFFKLLRRM